MEAGHALTGSEGQWAGAPAVRRLRLRILGISAAALCVLLGCAIAGAWLLHDRQLAAAQDELSRFGTLAAERSAQSAAAADLSLRAVQALFARVPLPGSTAGAVNAFLASVVTALPEPATLIVFDRTGRARYSSSPAELGVSARAGESGSALAAEGPDTLRVRVTHPDAVPGGPRLEFSRPLHASGGEPLGSVVLRYNLSYAEQLFLQVRPQPDTRLSLVDAQGHPVLTLPAGPGADAGLVGDARPAGTRSAQPTGLDVQRPVAGVPFALELSRSRDAVLQPWRGVALGIGGATLLAGALVVALASLLLTGVRQAERASSELQESRAFLRLIFDALPETLLVKDLEQRVVAANKAALQHATGGAALLGRRVTDFELPDSERALIERTDAQVLRSGETVEYEIDRKTPAGTRRLHVIKVPIHNAAGRRTGLLSVAHDITHAHQTLRQAQDSQALLQTVFDAMPGAVNVKDLEGRMVLVNRAFATQWGLPEAALVGRMLHGAILPEDTPAQERIALADGDRRAAQGETVEFELDRTFPAGLRRVRMVKAPVRDGTGAIVSVLTINTDVTDLQRSDAELQRSRLLLQAIFDNMPQILFVVDAGGRFLAANRTMERQWGVPPGALLGRKFRDALVDLGATEEEIQDVMAREAAARQGQPVEYVAQRTLPRGLSWQRIIKVALQDEAGAFTGLLTICEDVTERRKAERELAESRQLLQTVFDTIPHLLFVEDAAGKIMLANRVVERIWGAAPGSLVGQRLQDASARLAADSGELQEIRTMEQRVLAGETVEYASERTLPTGKRWLRVVKTPLREASGQISGIVSLGEDVTERRKAERDLAENRLLLQSVFDTIPHHLFVKDDQRRYVMINRAMAHALRVDPGELVGRHSLPSEAPDQIAVVTREDEDVLYRGVFTERTFSRTLADGNVHHFHAIKGPMRDVEGRVVGLVGVSNDITEKVEAEEKRAFLEAQLQQAQKMELVGRLAASVAHDFNNLLTPILGHAELMMGANPRPDQRDSLDLVIQASERAAELTRSLLSFGRKQPVDMRPVRLDQEALAFLPILKRLIGTSIQVRMALAPDLGLVLADSSQMQQVILNLAVNARDAMPQGGSLTIEMANAHLDEHVTELREGMKPGEYVMLVVADTGQGMDAETLTRVFEPFFTTKAPGKGTGLGLSIVYDIVQKHRGQVTVYSAVGQGTTFRVYLPRTQDAAAEATLAASRLPIPRGGETVAVVDDEGLVRHLVGTVLRTYGYTVVELAGSQDALDDAVRREAPYDLLVTDLIMPGMNGVELQRKLAKRFPAMKVLFMSGHSPHLLQDLGFPLDGQPFLSKPFPVELLARKVRVILDG